jgi:hypothetical protein
MDKSYMVEGYPHGCGVQLYPVVEYLTSLEDHCLLFWASPDLDPGRACYVPGEYLWRVVARSLY